MMWLHLFAICCYLVSGMSVGDFQQSVDIQLSQYAGKASVTVV